MCPVNMHPRWETNAKQVDRYKNDTQKDNDETQRKGSGTLDIMSRDSLSMQGTSEFSLMRGSQV